MSFIDTDKISGTFPLGMLAQMRALPGVSTVDKFGVNPVIATATDPEDCWEFGGSYPYDAWGTAPILYVSSSSGSDTQDIVVNGLDIEGRDVSQEITLTGQTNVVLPTPLWRVYRMENEGDEGDDLNGIVYCHTEATPASGVPADANVRAIMDGDNNQTLMGLYTIPKGKVGFLFGGEMGVEMEGNSAALAEFASLQYQSRRLGRVFKTKKAFSCIVGGSATYQEKRSFPDIVPELTDIRLRIKEVSATMGVWGTFDIMLFDIGRVPVALQKLLGY